MDEVVRGAGGEEVPHPEHDEDIVWMKCDELCKYGDISNPSIFQEMSINMQFANF